MREVDAIEQHRQLGGVELRSQRIVLEDGQPESALLEPLVRDDEAAAVPGEDLHPVASPGDEDKQVAGVDVYLPGALHQGD